MVRAQKRLAALDEHRTKLVAEIAEGQERLQRLRLEVSQVPQTAHATHCGSSSRLCVLVSSNHNGEEFHVSSQGEAIHRCRTPRWTSWACTRLIEEADSKRRRMEAAAAAVAVLSVVQFLMHARWPSVVFEESGWVRRLNQVLRAGDVGLRGYGRCNDRWTMMATPVLTMPFEGQHKWTVIQTQLRGPQTLWKAGLAPNSQQLCPSARAVWDSEARRGQDSQHTGPVGQIASPWCTLATLKSRMSRHLDWNTRHQLRASRLWWSVNTPLRPSVSKDPHVKPSLEEPGPPRLPWTRTTPTSPSTGGNTSRRVLSSRVSCNVVIPELGDGEKAQLLSQRLRSLSSRRTGSRGSIPNHSGCSTCAACDFLFLLPLFLAGAAVLLTSLATTALHAQWRWCWRGAVTLWRVPLPAHAGKEGPGSRPTSWSEIWTSQCTTRPTVDAWHCRRFVAPRRCAARDGHHVGQRSSMRRNPQTQSHSRSRRRARRCTTTKKTHVSRVSWRRRTRSTCRFGDGGRRKTIRGDQTLPWFAGEGQGSLCSTGVAVQCHDGLVPPVVCHPRLSPSASQLLGRMAPCPRCTRWCRSRATSSDCGRDSCGYFVTRFWHVSILFLQKNSKTWKK